MGTPNKACCVPPQDPTHPETRECFRGSFSFLKFCSDRPAINNTWRRVRAVASEQICQDVAGPQEIRSASDWSVWRPGPVRFACQSDHIGRIGPDGRICPQHLLELIDRHARSHREREEIYGLIGLWAEKVGAEDSTARGFNQNLEP